MIPRFNLPQCLLFLSAALLWAAPLWAQQQHERALADFDQIEFTGRGDLFLYQGNTPSVRIEVSNEADLDRIRTRVQGSTLEIEYRHDDDDWLDVAPKMQVYVTYPALRSLEVTGLADVESPDLIQSDRFNLEVEGMGRIDLRLKVASLRVESAGTANIELSGEADEVRILNDGTGTIDAFELTSKEADVEVNGTGLIRINSTERLQAEANGFGAKVKYRGDPKKTYFDTSGFASIKSEY